MHYERNIIFELGYNTKKKKLDNAEIAYKI